MASPLRHLAILVFVLTLMATIPLPTAGAGEIDNKKEMDTLQKLDRLLLCVRSFYDIDAATQLGDVDRARILLKQDPKKALSKNLMRTAVWSGRVAIVKLLLEYKADPEDAGYGELPVLYFALGHPKVVRVLLKAGANPKVRVTYRGMGWGPQNSTLLRQAAEKGYVETAKLLLDAGVPVDEGIAEVATPLLAAACFGQPKMVTFLLKNKASVRANIGRSAMEAAGTRIRPGDDKRTIEENARYKAVIDILQAQGIPIDFFTAIALNNVERVRELLKNKAELARSKDGYFEGGRSALTRAVDLDHQEIVVLLLDAGAPINSSKDEHGYTALHWAAYWGREKIAKLLIARKADANATANDGFTPLHESARLNTAAVAKLLLAAGAKVNAIDKKGRTPLSWTEPNEVRGDRAEMIGLLRKHGGTK